MQPRGASNRDTHCTRCTTAHQFFWQQKHTCGAVGGSSMEYRVGGQPHKTPHFISRHRYIPPWNDPPKKSLGSAQPPPHRCRTFLLLPVQMGYGILCGLWVWRGTNRPPCCPPLSNPSTPTDYTAWLFWTVRQLNGCSTPAPISRWASSG